VPHAEGEMVGLVCEVYAGRQKTRTRELGVGYTKYKMEFVEVRFYGIGLKETRPYLKTGEMMIYSMLGTISMGEGIRRICKAIHEINKYKAEVVSSF
jgi:hypothetical protein